MTSVSHDRAKREAPLDAELLERLADFVHRSRFTELGSVVTDLDGTAVHEDQGKIVIPAEVELGLERLVELGRPLILNTLRFPLSVIQTFGQDWYGISNAPLPAVTLNGSLLGRILERSGELIFDEIACFPMQAPEVERALDSVEAFLDAGVREVLLFYYPCDWRMGELIWTPVAGKVDAVREKYVSASAVSAVAFKKLRAQLATQKLALIFVLLDVPQDHLMAYQHSQKSQFFTSEGIDKLSGAQAMARHLNIDLSRALGAGDTEMDRFLAGAGCAVIVGYADLPYRGRSHTLRVPDSLAFGELLREVARLHERQPP